MGWTLRLTGNPAFAESGQTFDLFFIIEFRSVLYIGPIDHAYEDVSQKVDAGELPPAFKCV